MKTLGLIGGTTWHSTIDHYRTINELVNARLGGVHSAKLLLHSVDFADLQPPSDPAGWQRVGDALNEMAKNLERAGAECNVLCANTPFLVADSVQRDLHIPLLHIAEATAAVEFALGGD